MDRVWHLLGKQLSGDITSEETVELEQLLRQHPELYYAVQQIQDVFKLEQKSSGIEAQEALISHLLRMEDNGYGLEKIPPTGESSSSRFLKPRRSAIFIGFVAAAIVAVYLMLKPGKEMASSVLPESDHIQISTKAGSNSKIQLPDGSTIWLNAGSKIIYNKTFNEDPVREVFLNGEAFFEVAKNAAKPFIVHTRKIDVKVLGTSFNVKSYDNDEYTTTSLIEGSVEVAMTDRPSEKLYLKPSEKLTINNKAGSLLPEVKTNAANGKLVDAIERENIQYLPVDSTIVETSWLDDRLVVRQQSFSELAKMIERKYVVTFLFEEPALEELVFDANFKRETLSEVMQALQLANYFTYRIKDNTITVSK